MYVTTDEAPLHTKLFKERVLNYNTDIRGKGECGSYTGVVTGSYMRGMVLELDQDVILLLTDQHLIVPHCVRVGALVTLKNVHFVDPNFLWGKMFILDACCRTSVHVESFSPLESWCHSKSHSPSLLQKFIDSLSSAAKLWVLLVVSCFRKKFDGILSDKEILGSKHKEGLAQKYSSSYLPLSAFQIRHGVLLEFCRHDLCSGSMEVDCSHLRLVLPIANLVSYCKALWKKYLDEQENCSDFTSRIIQKKPLRCNGRSYMQPIKRVLRSEEIGVLVLGTVKISSSSGRLQLVDATGGVDILLNLPTTWDFRRIFEAKDFRIIIEGLSQDLADLDLTINQHLSCRSIFGNAAPLARLKPLIHLHHCPSDDNSESHFCFFDWKGDSQNFDCGKYHMFMLTHKFRISKRDLKKRSSMFAEAILLPWYLLVTGKYRDVVTSMVSSVQCEDSLKNFAIPKKHHTFKRCKHEQASGEVSNFCLANAGNGVSSHCNGFCSSCSSSYTEKQSSFSNNGLELSYLIARKGLNSHWMGLLHCADEHAKFISDCNPPRRKILLEFGPESFCKYEALKIGHCYLVKHEERQMLCFTKESYRDSCAKLFITSGTYISSLTFSSVERLQSADAVDGFPFCNLHISSNELIPKGSWDFEIPCLIGNSMGSEIYSDIKIFVPSSALSILQNVVKMLVCTPDEPKDSFVEEPTHHDHVEFMINAFMQSSLNSCSDCPLPQGNLITLHGLVLAFHNFCGDAFPGQPSAVSAEGSLLMFLQENAGVCVHVFANNHRVRIFCNISKETWPIGLGRDVYATFHRILVLGEPNKYMMTPVSFITIDHTSLMSGNLTHDLNYASETVGLHNVASSNNVPTELLYDALQSSKLRPIQFRCRVVALYTLVLEKAGLSASSKSFLPPVQSAFRIPFAGFIMDDGSGNCCCWADSETAAALLGLASENCLAGDYSPETFGRHKAGKRQPYRSTDGHLNNVIEQHGRIIVKNCGYIFDSSFQDLTFSIDSSQRLLSASDEDVLGSLITNAFFSTSWVIAGKLMDAEAMDSLEGRLSEVADVGIPRLPNMWATRVSQADMLAEGRNAIHGLV